MRCFSVSKQLVEAAHRLDLLLLLLGEIFLGELLQPLGRDLGRERLLHQFEALEDVAEHAVELVEVALVLHQRRRATDSRSPRPGGRRGRPASPPSRSGIRAASPARRRISARGRRRRTSRTDPFCSATIRPFAAAVNGLEQQNAAPAAAKLFSRRSSPAANMTAGRRKAGEVGCMPSCFAVRCRHREHPVLLAPAIWNRFPLLQYDTGGYLVRWYEGYLVPSRSTVYGLFLNVFAHARFLAGGRRPGRADGLGAGAGAARAGLRRPAAAAARRHRGAVASSPRCRGLRASC